ncbi:hypothetical protein [Spirosoma areae]
MKKYYLVPVFILLFSSLSYAQACQGMPAGWHIRICLKKTQAVGVKFWVGVGGDANSHRLWGDWTQKPDNTFFLPLDLRYSKEVWVKAQTLERGKRIHFCLRYDDTDVKHFDSDGDSEEHERSQDDKDPCDCN